MEIAEKISKTFLYRGIQIRVPEMEAFVLHKILVFPLRSNQLKKEKDIRTVAGLLSFILAKEEMAGRIIEIFLSFPLKWQRTIVKNSEGVFPDLNRRLKDSLGKA